MPSHPTQPVPSTLQPLCPGNGLQDQRKTAVHTWPAACVVRVRRLLLPSPELPLRPTQPQAYPPGGSPAKNCLLSLLIPFHFMFRWCCLHPHLTDAITEALRGPGSDLRFHTCAHICGNLKNAFWEATSSTSTPDKPQLPSPWPTGPPPCTSPTLFPGRTTPSSPPVHRDGVFGVGERVCCPPSCLLGSLP